MDPTSNPDALSGFLAGRPIRPRTAAADVADGLRAAISAGILKPGTALQQDELARAFGVSRMPVREAVRALEAAGLIEVAPHRGAVVAPLSAADAADLYAVRAALEPAALRLSAPRLGAADLDAASAVLDAMDRLAAAEDPPAGPMAAANRRFHAILYARAGAPRLLRLVEAQQDSASRYLAAHLAGADRHQVIQDEHHAILACLRRGEVEAACDALRRHIEGAAGSIVALLRERGD